ncbi:hypothetical protein [Phenylobacterium sp.]|uniref:hypothetical protein n=1 Tax=Phenylobacterium sp. TaxID=1871053 RepID=UPI003562E363
MSLKIGGSKSNSSGTSNTQINSTTMPVVPDWASNLTQSVAGRVGGLVGQDPQSQVAPVNPLQTAAGANAGVLSGSPWNFDGALDLYRGVANRQAPSISANIGQFMDPYLNGVVNATSADLDASDGKVRAQQALDLAGSGAFGGSGAALTQSATEGELARARATSLGALRSQGFAQALGGATSQAQLQQQQQAQRLASAQGIVDASTAYDANQRANIASQLATGDDLRNITQQQLQAPETSTAQIVAMLSGLPIGLFTGQATNGTSSTQTTGQNTNVNASAGIGLGSKGWGGIPLG